MKMTHTHSVGGFGDRAQAHEINQSHNQSLWEGWCVCCCFFVVVFFKLETSIPSVNQGR